MFGDVRVAGVVGATEFLAGLGRSLVAVAQATLGTLENLVGLGFVFSHANCLIFRSSRPGQNYGNSAPS